METGTGEWLRMEIGMGGGMDRGKAGQLGEWQDGGQLAWTVVGATACAGNSSFDLNPTHNAILWLQLFRKRFPRRGLPFLRHRHSPPDLGSSSGSTWMHRVAQTPGHQLFTAAPPAWLCWPTAPQPTPTPAL